MMMRLGCRSVGRFVGGSVSIFFLFVGRLLFVRFYKANVVAKLLFSTCELVGVMWFILFFCIYFVTMLFPTIRVILV